MSSTSSQESPCPRFITTEKSIPFTEFDRGLATRRGARHVIVALDKTYLFDFNGVLVDDERVHFAAFREIAALYGVRLEERAYQERYLAFDDATAFGAMFRDAGVAADEALIGQCVDQKLPLYMRAVADNLVVFPGAFELLRACSERGVVAIVSGALRVEIDYALERMGSTRAVRTIVAADDIAECKPDPAGYREALRRLGVAGSSAVVIEDTMAGVSAARGAGCRAIAVAHSYPASTLLSAQPDLIVDRISDLTPDMLDQVRSRPGDAPR